MEHLQKDTDAAVYIPGQTIGHHARMDATLWATVIVELLNADAENPIEEDRPGRSAYVMRLTTELMDKWAANITYAADAKVRDATKIIPSAVQIGSSFTITANDGISVSSINFVATAATVANVIAGLKAAADAAAAGPTHPWDKLTASNQTTYLKLSQVYPTEKFLYTLAATNGSLLKFSPSSNLAYKSLKSSEEAPNIGHVLPVPPATSTEWWELVPEISPLAMGWSAVTDMRQFLQRYKVGAKVQLFYDEDTETYLIPGMVFVDADGSLFTNDDGRAMAVYKG